MFEKIKPLGDRVLVKRLESEERTSGGLYIPDAAKEKATMGKVIAVGTGRRDNQGKYIPVEVAVGDTVYFGKYAGTEAGDGDHLIIREDEILGVVQK